MKRIKMINWLIFTMLLIVNVSCVRDRDVKITYPETMKIAHEDIYFNDTITDPYQWLESIHSDTTVTWIANQKELTFDYLSKIPFREKIRKDLTKFYNTPALRYSQLGSKYYLTQFWSDKYSIHEDSVIIYEMDNLKGKTQMIVDSGKLPDIDSVKHIIYSRISPDNHYFTYMYALPQDSGRAKIRILDVKNDTILPDTINIVSGYYKWMDWHSGNLYYYTQKKGKKWGIYSHKLNTPQENDSLILPYSANMQFSRDRRYMFFTDRYNKLKIKSLENPASKIVSVDSFKLQRYSVNFYSIQNYEDDIYMFCNQNPLQNKLVKVSIASDKQNLETIIPENEDSILIDFYLIRDKILAHYLHNASSRLFVFDLDGNNKTELPLPSKFGSVHRIAVDDEGFIFSFSSFAFPPTHYHIANISEPKLDFLQSTMPDFDTGKYITEQVWYASKDSAKVPMFITYKKGLKRNGKNPVLLNGYGGFGVSSTPSFDHHSSRLFLEKGGVYAVANVRGGGEFGIKWHEEGMKLNKQNVFDDFIAAAEYLIREKYTSSEKLALEGGSNGGLLLCACLVQRPELFKVVTAHRSVVDMLKSRKWAYEYGSVENEEEYRYLLNYSPLHNVKNNVHYPATLITTGMKEDNVLPWHSFKFAATLQNAQMGENPILIRTDSIAGHYCGGIDDTVDWLSFLFKNLGMKY